LSFWSFGYVRAAEESELPSTLRAWQGLDSKDPKIFTESCWIISEFHSDCIGRLLEIARSSENGKDESLRIRRSVETLGKLHCIQVIPLCIQRLDFEHRTGFASESDPVLGHYPFARCLANFGKVGVDAVLDYVGYGNSDNVSKRRLALFAFILQAGYVGVRVKRGTVVDYAKSYQRPDTRNKLDEVVRMIQLSPNDLREMIEH
jgi:hypothetical protein